MNKLAILVDGSSFIYRAYYALPQLTSDGRAIGAIYGFCSMLISFLDKHKSDALVVALDSSRHTFRSNIYPEYKANRRETPDDLKSQLPILREACIAFGLPTAETPEYEADDIIATYAKIFVNNGYDVRILSPDKDLMQLINEHVSLFDPIKSKIITAEDVVDKYGVTPDKMISLQALMGDSSDNVPGISGVGPKTAAKLLNTYGTIGGIYDHINDIQQHKLRDKLTSEKNMLNISLQLVTLSDNVNVDDNLDLLTVQQDVSRTIAFLEKYKLNSLIKRISKCAVAHPIRKRYAIYSRQDIDNFFKLNRIETVSIFCCSSASNAGILALCCAEAVGYCSFVFSDNDDLFCTPSAITYYEIVDALSPYMSNPEITKVGLHCTLQYFPNIPNTYESIDVMAYLLQGPLDDSVGTLFPDSDNGKLSLRNVVDASHAITVAELIFENYPTLKSKLQENRLLTMYESIERPLVCILRNMEQNGITISAEKLQMLSSEFKQQIQTIEERIFSAVGYQFNIGSVKQLSEALFAHLQIPTKVKKSLDIESLEELSVYSDVPLYVIEWRKLSKLLSTYTTSLSKLVNKKTERLHTHFNMTATVTGRLSSSNPNLQNIPVKTENGRKIKQCFISSAGYKFLSCDYSQIELRVLAHVAGIRLWQQAFMDNADIHAITAAEVFGVDVQNVTPEMRANAKTINFGIIYGMSSFGLSKILKVSREQASEYIQHYFDKIPEFKDFQQRTLEFARKNGYVTTIMNRRCYIRDVLSENYHLRQFSERQAVNAVIQGSAADIIKLAMIRISSKLEKLHSKMLLQIHDELVFETENGYTKQALDTIKNIMEHVVDLSVPLEVSTACSDHL